MSIIRKMLAKSSYVKIDSLVAKNNNLSDYSFRLYDMNEIILSSGYSLSIF